MSKIADALRELLAAHSSGEELDGQRCYAAWAAARLAFAEHDVQPQQKRKALFADLIGEDHAWVEELAAVAEQADKDIAAHQERTDRERFVAWWRTYATNLHRPAATIGEHDAALAAWLDSPAQRQPLSVEQIDAMPMYTGGSTTMLKRAFARDVEAAHGIKP